MEAASVEEWEEGRMLWFLSAKAVKRCESLLEQALTCFLLVNVRFPFNHARVQAPSDSELR